MNEIRRGMNFVVGSNKAGDICIRGENIGIKDSKGEVREMGMGEYEVFERLSERLVYRYVEKHAQNPKSLISLIQEHKSVKEYLLVENEGPEEIPCFDGEETLKSSGEGDLTIFGVRKLADPKELTKEVTVLDCALVKSSEGKTMDVVEEGVTRKLTVDNFYDFGALEKLSRLSIANVPGNAWIKLPENLCELNILNHEGLLIVEATGEVEELEVGSVSLANPIILSGNPKKKQVFNSLIVVENRGGIRICVEDSMKAEGFLKQFITWNPIRVPLEFTQPIDSEKFIILGVKTGGSLNFSGGFTDRVKEVNFGIIDIKGTFVVPQLSNSVEIITIFLKSKNVKIEFTNIPKNLKYVDSVKITGVEGIKSMWIEGDAEGGILHIKRKEEWVKEKVKEKVKASEKRCKKRNKSKGAHRSKTEQKKKKDQEVKKEVNIQELLIEKYKL